MHFTECNNTIYMYNILLIRQPSNQQHMKTINCREAGFDCDYIVRGETEEEVMKNGAEHAMKDHGMREEDITPEMKQKIRGLIRSS